MSHRLVPLLAPLLSCALLCAAPCRGLAASGSAPGSGPEMSLEECVAQALRDHRRRPASRFAVAAAEAQHRQALSGYWPRLQLQAGFERRDDSPNFVFPASTMGLPGQSVSVPPTTAFVTVPAGVFGPTPVQLPVAVPAQTIASAPQLFPVPAQDVTLLDRDTGSATIDAKWLLFDGGLRQGLTEQTPAAISAMKEEARRTDLEITDTVQRYYFGAVLARQIGQLGRDTLARMEATLSLTETIFQGGSARVSKTDYLDNKIMVESLRALVASLEKNEAMAQAALANAIGLGWRDHVTPRATEIPLLPFDGDLEQLVGTAYRFNPDWQQFEAGVRAAEGAVRTARSGHAPKVALTGALQRYWNDYPAGLATDRNRTGWTIGLGFELPLFDGFRTQAKIAETQARLAQLREQGFLLREGIGLQVKDLCLELAATTKAAAATQAALAAATENRHLTTRAYQQELVDTEKVIRAQLMEAMMSAHHLKARYDLAALRSRLSLVIGTEILRQIVSSP